MSHLDIQRTLQRAMRRADIPLRYSKGFNPHPELHFATALSTGARGMWEWFDVELEEPMDTEVFVQALNGQLPEGLSVMMHLKDRIRALVPWRRISGAPDIRCPCGGIQICRLCRKDLPDFLRVRNGSWTSGRREA